MHLSKLGETFVRRGSRAISVIFGIKLACDVILTSSGILPGNYIFTFSGSKLPGIVIHCDSWANQQAHQDQIHFISIGRNLITASTSIYSKREPTLITYNFKFSNDFPIVH
jgi:hypothetical protein